MKFNRYRISDKKILKYYQKLKKRLYKVEKDACTYMEEQKKAKHYRGMCQKYNEKKELKKLLKKYERIAVFSIIILMVINIIMLMMI